MAGRKKKGGSALKTIVTEAKSLRKRFPHRYDKLAYPWRDGYMAQASAIYASKHKGKSPVGKKKRKKKSGGTRRVSSITLKETHEARISRAPKRRGKKTRKAAPKHKPRKRTVGAARRAGSVSRPRRRSVGKSGNTGLILGVAALGLGAIYLMSKSTRYSPTTTYPSGGLSTQLQPTQNITRNTQSQDIVNYAIAAGYAANLIESIIDRLNNSSDSEVSNMYQDVNMGGDLGNWV